MKNPFKIKNAVSTVTDSAIGGVASFGYDWAISKVPYVSDLTGTAADAVKVAIGAVAGSMVNKSWAKAACNGIATVGAASLMKSVLDGVFGGENVTTGTDGLPNGMIGRLRMGQRGFRRVAGVAGSPDAFMSK